MTQTKFAALHGGMLARKGAAAPMLASGATGLEPPRRAHDLAAVNGNGSGHAGIRPAMMPESIGETHTSADLAPGGVRGAPSGDASCPPAPGGTTPLERALLRESSGERAEKRHRVTVRLSEEQKRRLVTAATQLGATPARLAAAAIESYLDQLSECELGDCACMRRKHQVGKR